MSVWKNAEDGGYIAYVREPPTREDAAAYVQIPEGPLRNISISPLVIRAARFANYLKLVSRLYQNSVRDGTPRNMTGAQGRPLNRLRSDMDFLLQDMSYYQFWDSEQEITAAAESLRPLLLEDGGKALYTVSTAQRDFMLAEAGLLYEDYLSYRGRLPHLAEPLQRHLILTVGNYESGLRLYPDYSPEKRSPLAAAMADSRDKLFDGWSHEEFGRYQAAMEALREDPGYLEAVKLQTNTSIYENLMEAELTSLGELEVESLWYRAADGGGPS